MLGTAWTRYDEGSTLAELAAAVIAGAAAAARVACLTDVLGPDTRTNLLLTGRPLEAYDSLRIESCQAGLPWREDSATDPVDLEDSDHFGSRAH